MKKQNTICWMAGIDVTLAVCFIYIVSRLTDLYEHPIIIQIAMAAALLGCCLYIWRKKTDEKKICTILIIMGIVMRIGYMLYTGCEERQHDLWDLDKSGYGHAAYLLTLIEDRHLPETNQVQMYQQPMFYFLGAGISGFINWILGSKEAYFLVDAAKTVSCAVYMPSSMPQDWNSLRSERKRNEICPDAYCFSAGILYCRRNNFTRRTCGHVYASGICTYFTVAQRSGLVKYSSSGSCIWTWSSYKDFLWNCGTYDSDSFCLEIYYPDKSRDKNSRDACMQICGIRVDCASSGIVVQRSQLSAF